MVSQVAISTYREVLEVVSEASEWADPYELEAIAETAFADLCANEPESVFPYGRGYSAGFVGEVR